jgi:S-adenosylmethionine/arginine decarboxylase-like enzyme
MVEPKSENEGPTQDAAPRNRDRVARPYGWELILDLHGCDTKLFNRTSIDAFFTELCDLIGMEKCDVHFWDDVGVADDEKQTSPLTTGTSAVCFILTSTIVIHTLDLLGTVFVNIFSCRSFEPDAARDFTVSWFRASGCGDTWIERTAGGGPTE